MICVLQNTEIGVSDCPFCDIGWGRGSPRVHYRDWSRRGRRDDGVEQIEIRVSTSFPRPKVDVRSKKGFRSLSLTTDRGFVKTQTSGRS